MRVLIIGAAGFAGRYLARELVARGHEVFGGTKSGGSEGAPVSTGEGDERADALPAIPLLRCDVTLRAEVEAAIVECAPDAVFLLAGVSSAGSANADPAGAFAVHVLGAVHVLLAIAERGVPARAVIVTSSEVYGRVEPADLPLVEDTPLRPEAVYGASKAAADLAAASTAAARDLDVVRVRPFNHTGPGQTREFVCPDFAAQIAGIVQGLRPPCIEVGNLDVRRDFSDVRDIARGYALALERGRSGEAYNLCSGRPTAVREVLDLLCQIAGVRPEVRGAAARARTAETPAVFGSFEKARAQLGWCPEIPLRRTLQDLLDRARAEGASPRI